MKRRNEIIAVKVKEYIDKNFDRNIRINEIAEMFNINIRSLEYIFKRKYKYTPKKYVCIKRLKKFKKLFMINNNDYYSCYYYADILGFNSDFAFSKFIKQYTGVSFRYLKKLGEMKNYKLIKTLINIET